MTSSSARLGFLALVACSASPPAGASGASSSSDTTGTTAPPDPASTTEATDLPAPTIPSVPHGSPSLAITADALYFAAQSTIVRFDRTSEAQTVLASFTPDRAGNLRGFGGTSLALNGTRLFYTDGTNSPPSTPPYDVLSIPLGGGEPRAESSLVGCVVPGCMALTDETLYHPGRPGDDGSDAPILAVDLSTGEATELDAPKAVALAVDDTRLYGGHCADDIWTISLDGAAESRSIVFESGCVYQLAVDADALWKSNGSTLTRVPLDNPDQPVVDTERFSSVPFVVREGVVFGFDGIDHLLVSIDENGRDVLGSVSATVGIDGVSVIGIAVDGDTLYWTEGAPQGPVTVQQLVL